MLIKKVPTYPIIPTSIDDNGQKLITTLREHIVVNNRTVNYLIDEIERIKKLAGVVE